MDNNAFGLVGSHSAMFKQNINIFWRAGFLALGQVISPSLVVWKYEIAIYECYIFILVNKNPTCSNSLVKCLH